MKVEQKTGTNSAERISSPERVSYSEEQLIHAKLCPRLI
jgi:hypothetical protein